MPGLAALLLAATATPPTVVFTLAPEYRLVEGIASDGETIWLSSVLDRTIIERRGRVERQWKLPATVGLPLGMAWDAASRLLWIATDCLDLAIAPRCDAGALIAVDRAGRVKRRLTLSTPLHVGDVSVGNGHIFVSDSRNGAVYRVAGDRLVALVSPGVGNSGQGSALTPDGKMLIVADYAQGIMAIDLASGARTPLLADGAPLRGIDGLARAGDWYIGVQNGGAVGRLLAFQIVNDMLAVKVLGEGGALADPTQLLVTRDAILVVADSGWASVDKSPTRLSGATIVRFARPDRP